MQGREMMVVLLRIKGFSIEQIVYFCDAFEYFTQHPEKYDGSTLTQDLYDIKGLEFASMLHDYLYFRGAWASKDLLRKSDKVLVRVMRKMNKSGVEIKWRQLRLWLLREVFNYAWVNRNFRGKKVTLNEVNEINKIYNLF